MDISFVVAMAANRVIGRDGGLPWRLPRDLKHFRKLTWGKPIVMGRKTHESLGRALPGRLNIVLSRAAFPHPEDVRRVGSPAEALQLAQEVGAEESMIIGGGQIYEAFLPDCRKIHLTLVEGAFEGDVFFPFDPTKDPNWRIVHRERWEADAENSAPADYLILNRVD